MSDSTEKGFSELSDSSFLIQLAYPAIQELGLDVERIVSECKISPKLLKDRSARFPHAAQVQFWRVLEEVSGDKSIGLHLANHVPVYRGQVLEYLFLSSPSFGDGLRWAANYQRLVTAAMQVKLNVDGDEARVVLDFICDSEAELPLRFDGFWLFLQLFF